MLVTPELRACLGLTEAELRASSLATLGLQSEGGSGSGEVQQEPAPGLPQDSSEGAAAALAGASRRRGPFCSEHIFVSPLLTTHPTTCQPPRRRHSH
jgi:hypothetical protein